MHLNVAFRILAAIISFSQNIAQTLRPVLGSVVSRSCANQICYHLRSIAFPKQLQEMLLEIPSNLLRTEQHALMPILQRFHRGFVPTSRVHQSEPLDDLVSSYFSICTVKSLVTASPYKIFLTYAQWFDTFRPPVSQFTKDKVSTKTLETVSFITVRQ